MNLYLLTAMLYLGVAFLAALDSALVNFTLLPWFGGLRWLRIHMITLGAVTQVLFGLLPGLATKRNNEIRVPSRLDTWLLLNAGIVTLIAGIPPANAELIFTGGTLVFLAVLFLIGQIRKSCDHRQLRSHPSGTRFYIAGLVFFLVGIIVGTGLWIGWNEPLALGVPIEVHIHANNWGLLSLMFAGLIVDYYRRWSGRELAWPSSINAIFWMMTLGALGLILGPWVQSNWFSVPGLILHLTATVWLLLNVVRPLWRDSVAWRRPGMWHLVTSYFWIMAPVLVAPLIIAGVPGFPGAGIEQNAPQALIYGWVLQFGFALIPFLFRRAFRSDAAATLGGSWFSFVAVHFGAVFLWIGIFAEQSQGVLHGIAYTLWALSLIPIVLDLVWVAGRSFDPPSIDGSDPLVSVGGERAEGDGVVG